MMESKCGRKYHATSSCHLPALHMPWTVMTRGRNRIYLTRIAIRCWLDPSPESLLLKWKELCHHGEGKAKARLLCYNSGTTTGRQCRRAAEALQDDRG